jgi:uncharacterized protein YbdZ (MbtH family)
MTTTPIFNEHDSLAYRVVKNHEEQYSIWPVGKDLPMGWIEEGFNGSKQACLDHIETVWVDMRPLSLRKQMEALSKEPALRDAPASSMSSGPSLVERLTVGDHDVRLVIRPDHSIPALKSAVDRGFIQIEFVNTKGGTIVGFPIDSSASNTNALKDDSGNGEIELAGFFTLNFQKVKCVAHFSLKSFSGKGKLELVH